MFGANHQWEHLGVLVCVVRLKISLANLPCAEQLWCVVVQCAKFVARGLGQLFFACCPHGLECGFEIGLSIMRDAQSDELIIKFQNVVPAHLGAIALVKPFVMPARHDFFLAEMTVDESDVILDSHIPL